MTRLILIEGFHGVGKSTLAKKMGSALCAEVPDRHIYLRTQAPNPLDINRLARFTLEQYDTFSALLHREAPIGANVDADLEKCISREGKHIFVNWFVLAEAYSLPLGCTIKYALAHELCEGRVCFEQYRAVCLARWSAFGTDADPQGVYLMEGALFQHPIMDLLGYYRLGEEEICEFLTELLSCLEYVSVELIYVTIEDIEAALLRAANERRDGRHDWFQGLEKSVRTCPYGIGQSLSGLSGVLQYYWERGRLEALVMQRLTIPIKIVKRQ